MRLAVVAALAAAVVVALPAAARADAQITATCNGTACSTGWYTVTVTVAFSVSGSNLKNVDCPGATISTDTTGTDVPCTVTFTDNTITGLVVTIKRDATAPTVSASRRQRGPDVGGWYNHGVGVTATGTDATSGVASCTSVTYTGPDSGSAAVSGTCTDNAGNVSAAEDADLRVRRDAAGRLRRSRPRGRLGRLVQPSGRRRLQWNRRRLRHRQLHLGHVLRPRQRLGVGLRHVPRQGGQHRDRHLRAPLRLDAADDRRRHTRPRAGLERLVQPSLVVTFAGTDATSGIASCDAPAYDKPDDPTAS